MFDKFSFWLQSGNTKVKKIIFVVISILVLTGLSYSLILLNSRPNSQSNSQVSSSSSSSNPEVDEAVFTTAPQLKKFDSQAILLPQRVFFNSQNQPVYVGDNLKLTIDGQKIEKSPEFILRNIENNGQNLILNEDGKTTLYFSNNKQFLQLSPNINSLTPADDGNFFFATQEETSIKISTGSNISRLSNSQEYSKITPNITFSTFEIRRINQQIYLFVYTDSTRKGTVEIWSIKQDNSKKVLTLNSVDSWKYDREGILVTTGLETTQAQTSLLTSNQTDLVVNKLDINNKLIEQKILGQLVAQRCTLRTSSLLYCLVKESSPDFNSSKDKDVLVQVDLGAGTISLPNRDLVFAGETIYFSPDGVMYIITQDQKQIYQFNIPKSVL